jgi:hypothetical protein
MKPLPRRGGLRRVSVQEYGQSVKKTHGSNKAALCRKTWHGADMDLVHEQLLQASSIEPA